MRRGKVGTKRVSVADCVRELAPACSPVTESVLTCFPRAAPGWALRSHVARSGAPATPARPSPPLSLPSPGLADMAVILFEVWGSSSLG